MAATQQYKNNAMLGLMWIVFGILIIVYAVTFSFNTLTVDNKTITNESEYVESTSNVLTNRSASPMVIIEPQLTINQNDLSFKLDPAYLQSYEMFKSKTIVSENSKNTRKQFEEFLDSYGIKIDENGMLVDVRGSVVPSQLIECQVMGYFPGKPYIKSNCS